MRELPVRKATFTPSGRLAQARHYVHTVSTPGMYLYGFLAKMSPWTRTIPVDGISQSNPVVVTAKAHGLVNNSIVVIRNVVGMTQINGFASIPLRVTGVTEDSFQLVGVNSTAFSTYAGGGLIYEMLDHNWPAPESSLRVSEETRRQILGYKLITGADICHVFPKVVWENDTIYDYCDESSPALDDKKYRIINSTGKVYKCLWNNDGGRSTIEPTSTSLARFSTTDGYVWKYMFTLNPSDRARFENEHWAPIRDLTFDDASDQWDVQKAAISGTVDAVLVLTRGAGYDLENTTITVIGDGVGAKISLRGSSSLGAGGQIMSVSIDEPGYGYTWAEVKIDHPSGSGAKFRALISSVRGHGFDPVGEFLARRVMIDIPFIGTESDKFMVGGDFRKMGITLGLRTAAGLPALATAYDAREVIVVSDATKKNPSDPSAFVIGQTIKGIVSGAEAYIAGITTVGAVVHIGLIEKRGTFQIGESLESDTGIADLDSITTPSINVLSGDVLYLEHRGPTTRSATQQENLKAVLEF